MSLLLVARRVRLSPARIERYVQLGLVRSQAENSSWTFDERGLARLRKIRRLRNDLGLTTDAIIVVMRLLDEIERLRGERR